MPTFRLGDGRDCIVRRRLDGADSLSKLRVEKAGSVLDDTGARSASRGSLPVVELSNLNTAPIVARRCQPAQAFLPYQARQGCLLAQFDSEQAADTVSAQVPFDVAVTPPLLMALLPLNCAVPIQVSEPE